VWRADGREAEEEKERGQERRGEEQSR